MPQITTPLAQVLNPGVQQAQTGTGFLAPAAQAGQTRLSTIQNREIKREQQDTKNNLQRLSNLGQAASTGLNIIKADPENSEAALRDMIEQRRVLLPKVGITDMTDTDELEKALNEGGVPAAQELLTGALNAAQSAGFKLPPPTTPDFKGVFTAIDPQTNKPTIFQRSDQGIVSNTGLIAPPKSPLVQVGAGGGNKERTARFGELFDESKNLDKTLAQISQIRGIVNEGGLGTIGTSGKVTKGIEKAFSAIGGLAKNLGLGSDEFDQGSIVASALKGTPLGEQAARNAKVSSLITNLAFAVSRAQGNKRITDKDFQAAVKTIGANADNPDQLVDVINQFGDNVLTQFETDVDRTGGAFGFTKGQFKSLRNIPSREKFLSRGNQDQKVTNGNNSQFTEGQTATGPNGQQVIFRNGKWESI